MADRFTVDTHERLTAIIKAVFEESDCIVVVAEETELAIAYSAEPVERIRPVWELAKETAVLVSPWLLEVENDCAWSMNLFTVEGLWVFPCKTQRP